MNAQDSSTAAFPGTVKGVSDAAEWIDAISAAQGFPDELTYSIQLCVEELFTNTVRHGGGKWTNDPAAEQDSPISVSISVSRLNDVVTVVLVDNGTAFDVSAAPPKPVDQPLEAAQPGGLGIQLINKFSHELKYDYVGGMNRTTLKFLWPELSVL